MRNMPRSILNSGAGKSKIIAALLWHLFQHEASHLVLVTSYTWKAADLIGTPHNPAFSSCTTFGINIRTPVPGDTLASRALLTPDVVLIINDEISFTDQAHLQVCLINYLYKMMYLLLHYHASNYVACSNTITIHLTSILYTSYVRRTSTRRVALPHDEIFLKHQSGGPSPSAVCISLLAATLRSINQSPADHCSLAQQILIIWRDCRLGRQTENGAVMMTTWRSTKTSAGEHCGLISSTLSF